MIEITVVLALLLLAAFLIVWAAKHKKKAAKAATGYSNAVYVVLYLILGALLLLCVISPVVSYNEYQQGQERAVELFIETAYETGNDELASYSVSQMWSFYNRTYTPGKQYYWGYVEDNSAVVEAAEQADYALGRLLEDEGFHCPDRRGSYYFRYTNFTDYYFREGQNPLVAPALFCGLIVLLIIVQTSDIRKHKKNIQIQDDTIVCLFDKKVTDQFRMIDVAQVSFFGNTGITLSVNGKTHKFHYIQNREEIRDAIMQSHAMMPQMPYPVAPVMQPVPLAQPAPANDVNDLHKYKKLLDEGVITQEEFDAKKKQLLGL